MRAAAGRRGGVGDGGGGGGGCGRGGGGGVGVVSRDVRFQSICRVVSKQKTFQKLAERLLQSPCILC